MLNKDLYTLLTEYDGNFHDQINAYVAAYPSGDDELNIEFEYVDENDDVIKVERYTLTIQER